MTPKHKKKLPKYLRETPPQKKEVKTAPISTDGEKLRWSLDYFDACFWCDEKQRGCLKVMLEKLKQYSSMTWGQIKQSFKRHHPVDVEDIIGAAQRRLADLGHGTIDSLWRLPLNGKPRLWGIREGATLLLLWYDPDHKVCPSQPR